jgi:hypothetical protein
MCHNTCMLDAVKYSYYVHKDDYTLSWFVANYSPCTFLFVICTEMESLIQLPTDESVPSRHHFSSRKLLHQRPSKEVIDKMWLKLSLCHIQLFMGHTTNTSNIHVRLVLHILILALHNLHILPYHVIAAASKWNISFIK